jgi:hypothetical protein
MQAVRVRFDFHFWSTFLADPDAQDSLQNCPKTHSTINKQLFGGSVVIELWLPRRGPKPPNISPPGFQKISKQAKIATAK